MLTDQPYKLMMTLLSRFTAHVFVVLTSGHRGLDDKPTDSINSGHEAIGVVEEVGSAITTVKSGDFVIAPFTHGCGHCPACLAGFDGFCQDHTDNFSEGTQAEYYRAQHAQWSLIKVPGKPKDYSEDMLKSLLTLADVMATGYHATAVANVKPGDTVVVMGGWSRWSLCCDCG